MAKNKFNNIEPSWSVALEQFLLTPDWQKLATEIKAQYNLQTVYPSLDNIFKAFWLTPLPKVKVVILGQDPYHGEGQAEGLSFSVPAGVALPPSLKNIYKEIETDLQIKKDFTNGHLESWATQGVFLLNAILTVAANSPASHRNLGWEKFTDEVIKTISMHNKNVVFMLWGNYARSKKSLIDTSKHLVLEAPHPSPLSAYGGFFGCRHFSQANKYLKSKGQSMIQW